MPRIPPSRKGQTPWNKGRKVTHCKYGHPRDGASYCRPCSRAAAKAYIRAPEARDRANARRRFRFKSDPGYRARVLAGVESYYERRIARDPSYAQLSYRREQKRRGDPRSWIVVALKGCRVRAIRQGLPYDVTADDLEPVTVCPVFRVPLVYGAARGHPDAPSIDRIDNAKGYVRGNLWIISRRANWLKGNATADELAMLLRALRKKGRKG